MSRGYGRIERAILDRLTEEPDNAFTVEDLAEWIYDEEWVDKKHRVAILRALRTLRRSNKNIGLYNDWTPKIVIYNLGSGKSYAMARQKNDELEGYRKHHSEADLRAWLEPGGKHHHLVVEGGAWWRHWQMEVAKRDGDSARLAELEAEQDRSVKELGPGLREAADKAGL